MAWTHAGVEIVHFPTRCINRAWEAWSCRPSWEMNNFGMGMCSCFYPMTCKKHQGSHVETAHISAHLFSAWSVSWSWDNRIYQPGACACACMCVCVYACTWMHVHVSPTHTCRHAHEFVHLSSKSKDQLQWQHDQFRIPTLFKWYSDQNTSIMKEDLAGLMDLENVRRDGRTNPYLKFNFNLAILKTVNIRLKMKQG